MPADKRSSSAKIDSAVATRMNREADELYRAMLADEAYERIPGCGLAARAQGVAPEDHRGIRTVSPSTHFA